MNAPPVPPSPEQIRLMQLNQLGATLVQTARDPGEALQLAFAQLVTLASLAAPPGHALPPELQRIQRAADDAVKSMRGALDSVIVAPPPGLRVVARG